MSRYRIEWQMGGEISIDTGDSDWTPDEVQSQATQVVMRMVDEVIDAVADEFDDCDVSGEGTDETKVVRL